MEARHSVSDAGFAPTTEQALEKMGYEIKPIDGVARVEAIVDHNGMLEGGTESRYHGKVAAYCAKLKREHLSCSLYSRPICS